VGQPFTLQPTTLFTYRHSNQDFGHNATSLARVYYSNRWDYDWEFNTYDSQLNLGTNSDNYFRGPKNQVAAYSDLESNWRTVLLRFTWEDGDVNADQTVDVTDLQAVVNFAFDDRKPNGQMFNYTDADFNADATINVTDIVGNVERLLSYEPTAGSRAHHIYKVQAGTSNLLAVEGSTLVLHNADQVAALQFTVAGATERDVAISSDLKGRYTVAMRPAADGLRIVVYSVDGHTLQPGDHQLLASLPAGATVSDACLSDPQARRLAVTVEGNVTTGMPGVASLTQQAPSQVYDLQGRLLDAPWQSLPSGIYLVVVNGKQYKVKK